MRLNSPISLKDTITSEVQLPVLYPVPTSREHDPYLKNVFPSGFNAISVRHGASKDKYYLETMSLKSKSIIASISQAKSSKSEVFASRQKHPYSISEWAKGDRKSADQNYNSCTDDDYADVAGAYFREVSRCSNLTDTIVDLPDGMDPLLTIQGQQSSAGVGGNPGRRATMAQEKVLLSTSVLPCMHPLRSNMKRGLKVSSTTRPTASDVSIKRVPAPARAKDVQPVVAPKLLADTIVVQLYEFKEMFGALNVAETAAAGKKFRISSALSFQGIRSLVFQNFHELRESGMDRLGINSVSNNSSWLKDEAAVTEVALHYYSWDTKAWRPVRHKTDWSTAKLSALECSAPLQLTYTIILRSVTKKGPLACFESPSTDAASQQMSMKTRARMVFSDSPTKLAQWESPPSPCPVQRVSSIEDDDGVSSVEGISRVSVTVSVRSLRSPGESCDESISMPLSVPLTLASQYRPRTSTFVPSPQRLPMLAKQAELALALEQRLMLHRK